MFGKKKDKNSTRDNKIKKNNEITEVAFDQVLSKKLDDNIDMFKRIFDHDETMVIRRFQNKYLSAAKCCVIYFDAMVNLDIINENIIKPILCSNLAEEISKNNLLEDLQHKVIGSHNASEETNVNNIVDDIIYGDTLFLIDGYDKGLIIKSKGWQTRSITEPQSEQVLRGPREGFTESIMINISLIRRKIKNPEFKIKFMSIGIKTHTKICICYMKSIASENILKELERRLEDIDIDGIIDSGYIQELIRDAPFSPFQTVGNTERPDVIAAKLLEGRIAIMVDGSPAVLTVPCVLAETAQANEDYYNNYIFASLNRIIRTTAAMLATIIPSLYLVLVTFHQEMIPTPLLLSFSASREGIPIPTSLSLFIMLLIFDILREAGTRMPSSVGQAVNIVGALVLGEAAVQAKLVGAPVVIITALSGILTLLNINIVGSIIILRFFLLLLSSVLGIYGFIFGYVLIILHLASIRSFGVPYMLDITSVKNHNGQDVWVRAPWWSMVMRPKIIAAKNIIRQASGKNKRR